MTEAQDDAVDRLAFCKDCATETGFPAAVLRIVFTEYFSLLFGTDQPTYWAWARDEEAGIQISNVEIYFFLLFV